MSSTPAPTPPMPPTLPTLPPEVALAGGPQAITAELADLADARDRLMARTVTLLARLGHDHDHDHDDGDGDLLAGLSPQVWLEQVCRFTGSEARRLLGVAEVLVALPAVVAGLADGRLSWSQARELATAARHAPAARRAELDALIGRWSTSSAPTGPTSWSAGCGRPSTVGHRRGCSRPKPPRRPRRCRRRVRHAG